VTAPKKRCLIGLLTEVVFLGIWMTVNLNEIFPRRYDDPDCRHQRLTLRLMLRQWLWLCQRQPDPKFLSKFWT
jgi:hypothetical protein